MEVCLGFTLVGAQQEQGELGKVVQGEFEPHTPPLQPSDLDVELPFDRVVEVDQQA